MSFRDSEAIAVTVDYFGGGGGPEGHYFFVFLTASHTIQFSFEVNSSVAFGLQRCAASTTVSIGTFPHPREKLQAPKLSPASLPPSQPQATTDERHC